MTPFHSEFGTMITDYINDRKLKPALLVFDMTSDKARHLFEEIFGPEQSPQDSALVSCPTIIPHRNLPSLFQVSARFLHKKLPDDVFWVCFVSAEECQFQRNRLGNDGSLRAFGPSQKAPFPCHQT
jgi:hypothetical protein